MWRFILEFYRDHIKRDFFLNSEFYQSKVGDALFTKLKSFSIPYYHPDFKKNDSEQSDIIRWKQQGWHDAYELIIKKENELGNELLKLWREK